MTRLAGLLVRYSGPIEADLDRVYGIDLLDFWRGRIPIRKLANRVLHLPPGSAVWRAARFDAAWSEEAHLLHAVVNAVQGRGVEIKSPSELRAADERADRHLSRAEQFLARKKAREEGGDR